MPDVVEGFLDALEGFSRQLMFEVVNMSDQNVSGHSACYRGGGGGGKKAVPGVVNMSDQNVGLQSIH